MSYQYKPTKAEERAADVLRAKGWRVDQPRCPECNGWGHRTLFKRTEDYVVGEGITYMVPCSLGCAEVNIAWTLGATTGVVVAARNEPTITVTADGTAGMRRGVS